MTIFNLVKVVLDELYTDGERHHGSQLDQEICKRLEYLSASYKSLGDKNRKSLEYSDPATRFAYVYGYVAAHSDYIVQILQNASQKASGL